MKKVLYKDICVAVSEVDGSKVLRFICRTDETGKNFMGLKSGKKYYYNNGVLSGNGTYIECEIYSNPIAVIGMTNAFFRGINKEVTFRNVIPNSKYKSFFKMIEQGDNPSKIISVRQLFKYENYFYKTYKREVKSLKKSPISEEEKVRSQYFNETVQTPQIVQEVAEKVEPVVEMQPQPEQKDTHVIVDEIENILNKAKENVDGMDLGR